MVRTSALVRGWTHSAEPAGSSGLKLSRPPQPRRMPTTSMPASIARVTTALIHGLRPGTSPPPVRMPIRIVPPWLFTVISDSAASLWYVTSVWRAILYYESAELLLDREH